MEFLLKRSTYLTNGRERQLSLQCMLKCFNGQQGLFISFCFEYSERAFLTKHGICRFLSLVLTVRYAHHLTSPFLN